MKPLDTAARYDKLDQGFHNLTFQMTCRLNQLRIGFSLLGFDVLVNAEKVIRIVFSFNFHETIVIVPVGRFDTIDSFIHHKVYIGAA